MMTTGDRRVSGWLGIVALAAACGGGGGSSGPDIAGTYQVSYHTLAESLVAAEPVSCASEGEAATEPPFFRIIDGDFGLEYEECDEAGQATCDFTLVGFDEAIDGGWRTSTSSTQIGGGTTCALHHWEWRAVFEDSGELRVVVKEWDVFNELPEDECTLGAADQLTGEPMCSKHEVIVGALVAGG